MRRLWVSLLVSAVVLPFLVFVLLPAARGSTTQNDHPFYNEDVPNKETFFEQHYSLWKQHCEEVRWSSDMNRYLDSAHFRELVALGPRIVPLIVEKRKVDPSFTAIYFVWSGVTGVVPDPNVNPWAEESLVEWWEGGQRLTNRRFDEAYAQGDLDAIRSLGFAALPKLMGKLGEGDHELLDIVKQITRSSASLEGETPAQRAANCLQWWEANKEKWLIPFPDRQGSPEGD